MAATLTFTIPEATTERAGTVTLATRAETTARAEGGKAVVPSGLADYLRVQDLSLLAPAEAIVGAEVINSYAAIRFTRGDGTFFNVNLN